MLADGRRLGEEARNRNCFCAPSEPALDLRAAPVFQSNFPHGYGIANPVNGDTYGALFNPNWENCGHCAPTISNPSGKLCFLFRTERQSNAFPCDSFVVRVAVTERVDDAWWGVDLGNTIRVRSVRLQNRADCCPWRLEGINIYLGEHGNTNHRFIENSMVAHDIPVPQATPLLIPINATGRYLFVRKLTAGGYYSGLSLCEIEVFGEANA